METINQTEITNRVEKNVDELDTKSILAELLSISKQNSSNSRFQSSKQQQFRSGNKHEDCSNNGNEKKNFEIKNDIEHPNQKGDDDDNAAKIFVEQHIEKAEMNQYWYSSATIQTLCDAMMDIKAAAAMTSTTFKIAFLSTPSLYFALPISIRKDCYLFDIDDNAFDNYPGFIHYNFEDPENVPASIKKTFDMVVIDPPFVTRDVWELYHKTTCVLLKHDLHQEIKVETPSTNSAEYNQSYVLATTISENESLMKELFNAKPTIFKPNIPNLIYQYKVYVNCVDECESLKMKNSELG